jgi:hypothetical protein
MAETSDTKRSTGMKPSRTTRAGAGQRMSGYERLAATAKERVGAVA